MKTTLETLDVGQANEFKLACRRNLLNEADIKWLCEGDNLAHVPKLRQGYAEIRMLKHVVNMDAPSTRIPKDWEVREQDQLPNRARGQVEWNPADTSYLSEKQKTSYIGGSDLQKELGKLKDQLVVTDAVVDFYLDHPEIPTPEAWLGKWVVAWGRIYYRSSDGHLVVRGLYCDSGGSRSGDYYYVQSGFSSRGPALVVPAGK